MARCDSIKYIIYNDFNIRSIINKIALNGNDDEQEISFKLLLQLCFDEKVCQEVLESKFLYDIIRMKSKQFKQCQSILFLIELKMNRINSASLKAKPKHIMLSYTKESKQLCYRIKNELEKMGKKCWIDVDDLNGSNLETIINAINQSTCVLMCVNEKYKENSSCRLEAEYLNRIKKSYVPLIMQKGYKPDGW